MEEMKVEERKVELFLVDELRFTVTFDLYYLPTSHGKASKQMSLFPNENILFTMASCKIDCQCDCHLPHG